MKGPIRSPLSVCPSVSLRFFSGIVHYYFPDFLHDVVDNWNIQKLTEPIILGNWGSLGKKAQSGPN